MNRDNSQRLVHHMGFKGRAGVLICLLTGCALLLPACNPVRRDWSICNPRYPECKPGAICDFSLGRCVSSPVDAGYDLERPQSSNLDADARDAAGEGSGAIDSAERVPGGSIDSAFDATLDEKLGGDGANETLGSKDGVGAGGGLADSADTLDVGEPEIQDALITHAADADDVPVGTGDRGGDAEADGATGTGGQPGTGGKAGTGGVTGAGGITGTGGVTGTGDTTGTGGTTATGGTTVTGGTTGAGGTTGTGGTTSGGAGGTGNMPGQDASADDAMADAPGTPDATTLQLLWSDEFDGAANTGVDPTKWSYITWNPDSMNYELQKYTSRVDNVFLDGAGHLVLRALNIPYQGYSYTSGRVTTQSHYAAGPNVRIEARAKLPAGLGSAPVIVAQGTTGYWPACGQLSLAEQYGHDKSSLYTAAYATTSAQGSTGSVRYDFPNATTASADFHVYAVNWYVDHLVFEIDGNVVLSKTFNVSSPFRSIPAYISLALPVGGTYGGTLDIGAFPMDMTIDYVRVYGL